MVLRPHQTRLRGVEYVLLTECTRDCPVSKTRDPLMNVEQWYKEKRTLSFSTISNSKVTNIYTNWLGVQHWRTEKSQTFAQQSKARTVSGIQKEHKGMLGVRKAKGNIGSANNTKSLSKCHVPATWRRLRGQRSNGKDHSIDIRGPRGAPWYPGWYSDIFFEGLVEILGRAETPKTTTVLVFNGEVSHAYMLTLEFRSLKSLVEIRETTKTDCKSCKK